jgi:hypothetical protein
VAGCTWPCSAACAANSPASRTLDAAADHPRPLAENSPSDFLWGCRDPQGEYGGQNSLGLALMQVRAELIADVRTRLAALAGRA